MKHRRGDLLVVGYAVASQVELHVWHPDGPVLPRLVLLAGVLCLLARRRLPRLAPLLCAAGGTVTSMSALGEGTGVGIVTAGVAAALLGRHGRPAVPALVALVAVVVVATAAMPTQASDLVTAPLLLLAVAGTSAGLFRVRRQADEVRARIEEVQASARDSHLALLTDERRRLARELHDVVSHHLTVAALQASGARVQLQSGGSDEAVVAALRSAEEAGRSALADLRPLLDAVGGEHGLSPQPGPADLPRLVQQVRQAGLEVRLSGPDVARLGLPVGHGLVAYRVLQEALTNAVRHGRRAVDVRLSVEDARLLIEVDNEVAGARPPGADGHGLVGMRERLALYGGRLEAGRRGGRWSLRAELPLPEAVPA